MAHARRRFAARRALAAMLAAIALAALPSAPSAQSEIDETVDRAFGVVETLFGVFLPVETIRAHANEGCRTRAVDPLFEIVGAQYAFALDARVKAQAGAVRSWETGEHVVPPHRIKREFASGTRRLRKYLGPATLVLSCYEYETLAGEEAAEPPFRVVAYPRACDRLGDRTYYFDPVVGYRYRDGCVPLAGPGDAPLAELVE